MNFFVSSIVLFATGIAPGIAPAVENLAQNPSFEQGEHVPAAWNFNSRKTESLIVWDTEGLRHYGYDVPPDIRPRRVPAWLLRVHQIADGVRFFRVSIADVGWARAPTFWWHRFAVSGNRFRPRQT